MSVDPLATTLTGATSKLLLLQEQLHWTLLIVGSVPQNPELPSRNPAKDTTTRAPVSRQPGRQTNYKVQKKQKTNKLSVNNCKVQRNWCYLKQSILWCWSMIDRLLLSSIHFIQPPYNQFAVTTSQLLRPALSISWQFHLARAFKSNSQITQPQNSGAHNTICIRKKCISMLGTISMLQARKGWQQSKLQIEMLYI